MNYTSRGNIRFDTLNRVSLLGLIAGFAGLAAGFVVIRPNRLAPGNQLFLWQLSIPFIAVTLCALLVLSLFILFYGKPNRSQMFLPGIAGNALIILVLLGVASAAKSLGTETGPYTRVSPAAGSWLLLLSGYILIVSSVKELRHYNGSFPVLIISFSGIFIIMILLFTGYFNEISIIKEYLAKKERFFQELLQHLYLSFGAVLLAVITGLPFGILTYRKKKLEKPIFAVINMVQTIPSLALFGLMIAPLSLLSRSVPFIRSLGIQGIGTAPALIALTLYALLPVTRNTYISLKMLDSFIVEAGIGMGMTKRQVFLSIEVPLALPIIAGGIRTSTVQAIGNTTVAALIGAGGLGTFIFQGLGQAVPDLILLGAIPTIILAVLIDRGMFLIVKAATPRGIKKQRLQDDRT